MAPSDLLEDQIWQSFVRAEFPPGWPQDYVPEGCLSRLITRDSIIREFTRDGCSDDEHDIDEDLLNFILKSAQKLLAISLLANVDTKKLRQAMEEFKSCAFNDSKLPVKSLDPDQPPWSRLRWTPMKLNNFRKEQWKCFAPVFRVGEINLDLENLHILPFMLVSKEKKAGHFGNVWEVKIHESHLEKPMRKVRQH